MSTLISRKEAIGILALPRRRFEALVEEGKIERVLLPGWERGMYRRRDVEEIRLEEMRKLDTLTK